MKTSFKLTSPWAHIEYEKQGDRIVRVRMVYGSTLVWDEVTGFSLTHELNEWTDALGCKGSAVILGGGDCPYEAHVAAILREESLPVSDARVIADLVSGFRRIYLSRTPDSLELEKADVPLLLDQRLLRLTEAKRRVWFLKALDHLANLKCQSDAMKIKINFVLGLRDNIGNTTDLAAAIVRFEQVAGTHAVVVNHFRDFMQRLQRE